jgi:ribosome-binding factor A
MGRMQNADVKRAVRVAERVKEALASEIATLRDPRLVGAIVSRVEMTDDLQLAKVYVRALSALDEKGRKAMLKGFDAASSRLRRDVTRAVSLRYAPILRFYFDDGLDAEVRVAELLAEIDAERRGEKT